MVLLSQGTGRNKSVYYVCILLCTHKATPAQTRAMPRKEPVSLSTAVFSLRRDAMMASPMYVKTKVSELAIGTARDKSALPSV